MTALRYACPDCGFRLMTPRRCGGCQAKHDAAAKRAIEKSQPPRRNQA